MKAFYNTAAILMKTSRVKIINPINRPPIFFISNELNKSSEKGNK